MDTPETRERGLMFRKGLGAGHGMLFVFDKTGEYAFWMKNMTFSIDILWLADDGEVVRIGQDVNSGFSRGSAVVKAGSDRSQPVGSSPFRKLSYSAASSGWASR